MGGVGTAERNLRVTHSFGEQDSVREACSNQVFAVQDSVNADGHEEAEAS